MFEAHCPSCNASYQVDERRVPQQGLKMRCPKCGESFQVNSPVLSHPPVLGAALGLSSADLPAARTRHRPTMMGVGDETSPPRPSPPRPAGAPRPSGGRKTMLGVAPAAERLELAELEDEASDSGRDEFDLSLDLPSKDVDLPAPAGRRPPSAHQIDLPSIPPSGGALGADSDEPELLDLAPALPDLAVPRPRPPNKPPPGRKPPPPRPTGRRDLPSPTGAGLPRPARAGLPDLPDDLPDLDLQLPTVGGLPMHPSQEASEGVSPASAAETGVEFLDPLEATSEAPPSWGQPAELGDELGASADDIFGHGPPTSVESVPPSGRTAQDFSQFEPGNFEQGYGEEAAEDEAEFDAFPTDEGGPAADSGPAGYGDVALDGGGGDFDLGEDIERPAAPGPGDVPRGPAAAASAAVELPEAGGADRAHRKKKRRKATSLSKGTRIAIAGVLLLAVAGGALASLVPDVGPYGVYLVMDTLRADEYQAQLDADIQAAQKNLAKDTASTIEAAYRQISDGRTTAPRFHQRTAYAAHVGFLSEIRFGSSDVSAQAEVLFSELKEADPALRYLDLARMTRDAAQGRPEVAVALAPQVLTRGVEYAVVVGEAALLAENGKLAQEAWKRVLAAEDSARAHFGMARTLALGGAPRDDVLEQVKLALERNPNHVGARLIGAELSLGSRDQDTEILESLEPIIERKLRASVGERVDAYTISGELHLRRSRLKKAEEAFGAALSLDAGSWKAQRGLAQVFFQGGRYSEALARFEGAVRAAPQDLATNLGVVRTKLRLEQLDDAVKLLEPLVKKYPQSVAVSYWVGRVKEAVGDKEAAQKFFEGAIQSKADDVPELVLSYVALTRLLGQKGQFAEASEVIRQAENRFPKDPAIYEALGELAANSGSYDDAVKHYEKAISLDPNNLGLKFARGIALRQARRFDDAAQAFDAVEKESPDYPGLALERGNLFEASGKSAEALAAYEAALSAAPEDVDLQLRVACGKASSSQHAKEAIKMLDPIVEARQGSAEVNFCMGLAHLNAGDPRSARRYLQTAVSRDPTRAKHHLYVGWVALELDDLALARLSLEKAIELDQTLADAYWKRGELRVRQKAVRDALKDLDKALELAPSRSEAYAQKAMAFIELGQEQDAISAFERAVSGHGVDPYWRYKYGELLLASRQAEPARAQLELAVAEAGKLEDPVWLPNAHRLLALSLGDRKEAIAHYQAYIEAKKSDPQDPYLREAIEAVNRIARAQGYR